MDVGYTNYCSAEISKLKDYKPLITSSSDSPLINLKYQLVLHVTPFRVNKQFHITSIGHIERNKETLLVKDSARI